MELVKYNKNSNESSACTSTSADVYFLIQRFLSTGRLKRTLQVLNEELEELKIWPKRIDWQGNQHERTVEDMQNNYSHIRKDFLLHLCSQASIALNPHSSLLPSILSFRSKPKNENGVFNNVRQILNYLLRSFGSTTEDIRAPFNIINRIRSRELGTPFTKRKLIGPRIYCGMQMQRCTIGHLSAVYCLLFDHSGHYVVTGADDLLVKLWSLHTGRLIGVFRGASSEITDIAVDPDNFMLAAGSIDRILRVWNLQTGTPIAVLTGHTGMITSVNFCPTSCWQHKYLVSTSTDGTVAFWTYNSDGIEGKVQFRNSNLYQEKIRPGQAQMICSSFSPGGTFLATGSADHHVRVYYMKGDEGPQRILQTEAHTDRVDSIQWAHSGLRFLSGSKDGTAIIWWFERQQWRMTFLDMRTTLPSDKSSNETDIKKIRVTMVAWDRSDISVVTAVSDHTLKVWAAATGQLIRVLKGHTDEAYVLEPHPHDHDIILSAGHDGQLIIWDIHRGDILFKYTNTIEGQGFGAIFDAKWSPDGCTISASDSHGDILTFGLGPGSSFYKELPRELFFHTDYRPLVRDQNYWVLDEQTQVPPHLMPPPFLVNIDGNPYPPVFQRLVPGRENCNVEQLVPNIVIGNEGIQEVIQDVPLRFFEESDGEDIMVNASGSMRSQRIRQSTGDWQTDHTIEWKKNVLVRPISVSLLNKANEFRKYTEEAEMKEYQKQLRTRPLMISTAGPSSYKTKEQKKKRVTKKRNRELDLEHYDVVPISAYDSQASSSEDWTEEMSEPRTRRSKRRTNNRHESSSDNNEDEDLTDESDATDEDESDEVSEEEKERRSSRNAKERTRRKSPKPSTSRYGTSKASAPKNRVTPRKDPVPKMAQTAEGAELSANIPSTSKGPKIKVSEQYKLSEWLSETRPRKSPYYPQINDEIVYFVQGHILYIEAVKAKTVYEPNIKDLPWVKGMQLKGHEFCKVVGIKYEIKPPRLCCLRLALQDENGGLTGKTFTVRYHDMPDVLDFFVLKQCYLTALSREWNAGERFRCMIDDNWWIGEITNKSPATELYTDSAFMCYEIVWSNGEQERMSPWDMEPTDESRIPEDEKEAVPVLPNELWSVLYKPLPEDWPNCERDTTCKAISQGIAQVMGLAIAEPFLVPVDINVYPTYAMIVEYPIDLSTIKSRFENMFYRRVAAAQFDIRYLETNAAKFNERHSPIVKHAKIITELCLRILQSGNNVIDINQSYHQLVDDYDASSSSEDNLEDIDLDQPSTSRGFKYLPVRSWKSPDDWKIEARGLVESMWQTEDSVPFKEPVNKYKYPAYHLIIKNPMDLNTVKERLEKYAYLEPRDFCSDMRLIFQNSRTFNTNKRSRIYVMTVRLSAMFEEHMKKILSNWRSAKKRLRRLSYSSFEENEINVTTHSSEEIPSTSNNICGDGIIIVGNGITTKSDSEMAKSSTEGNSDSGINNKIIIQNGNDTSTSTERLNEDFDPQPSTSRQTFEDFQNSISILPVEAKDQEESQSNLTFNEDSNNLNIIIPKLNNSININELESGNSQNNINNFSDDDDDDDDGEWNSPTKLNCNNENTNDSSSEEDQPLNYLKKSKGKSKKNLLLIMNKHSDSEEDDSHSLLKIQTDLRTNKKRLNSEDKDEDFCPEDSSSSSDSNAPLKKRKATTSDSDYDSTAKGNNNKKKSVKRRKREPSFVVDEEEEEDEEEEIAATPSTSQSSDSDTSDEDVPLRKTRRRKRKKARKYSSSDSDDDDSDRVSKLRKKMKKKRRKVLVSVSEEGEDNNRLNGRSKRKYLSVSSRGRVRKITEKAAAFLKKSDKRNG